MVKKIRFALALGLSGMVFAACGDAELAIQEAYDDCISRLDGPPPAVPNQNADGQGGKGGGECTPGEVIPECAKASDCPKPKEARCAEATCTSGKCGFSFRPVTKLESQIKGDCLSQYCDGQGQIIVLPDSDAYNDGKQCTIDQCTPDGAVNIPFPDGSPCPETGLGLCLAGECVACIGTTTGALTCEIGLNCVGTKCVPMHCSNSIKDVALGETAADCGGPCLPCATGNSCKVDNDCLQGVCAGTCSVPICTDGVKNDGETGIDCGGPPSCKRCGAGQGCDLPSDCESKVCWAGICEAPKCDDGVQNGDELSIDCGGSCLACGN